MRIVAFLTDPAVITRIFAHRARACWGSVPGTRSEITEAPLEPVDPAGLGLRFWRVDHSIPGSGAFGIETPIGWVIYSGDLRIHGHSGWRTKKFAKPRAGTSCASPTGTSGIWWTSRRRAEPTSSRRRRPTARTTRSTISRLENWLDHFGFRKVGGLPIAERGQYHASGHIDGPALETLIEQIGAERILPVHTGEAGVVRAEVGGAGGEPLPPPVDSTLVEPARWAGRGTPRPGFRSALTGGLARGSLLDACIPPANRTSRALPEPFSCRAGGPGVVAGAGVGQG